MLEHRRSNHAFTSRDLYSDWYGANPVTDTYLRAQMQALLQY